MEAEKILTQQPAENPLSKDLTAITKKIDTQRLKETLVNFIVPLVSIVVMVLLGIFVIKPGIKDIPALKQDLETKENLETVLRKKVSDLNKLVDYGSVVQEDSDLVNKLLVSDPDVLKLSTQISIMAAESGFDLTRLTYSFGTDIESTDGYDLVNVSMGGTANYNQLLTFLQTVEQASRLIDVFNFRYSLDTDDNGSTVYGVSFILVSPYLSVESDAVTDDPISLDITSPEFVDVLNKAKALKHYDIQDDQVIPDVAQEVEEVEDLTQEPPAQTELPAEIQAPTE